MKKTLGISTLIFSLTSIILTGILFYMVIKSLSKLI